MSAAQDISNERYRPGVRIVLLDMRGEVLVGRRADLKKGKARKRRRYAR